MVQLAEECADIAVNMTHHEIPTISAHSMHVARDL